MANAATHRARGASWEKAVGIYLGGFRKRLQGWRDTGDIGGLDAIIVECKAPGPTGRYEFQQWVLQLQREVDRDPECVLGLLAAKRQGKTAAEDGYWMIDPRHLHFVIEAVQHAAVCEEYAA